MTTKAKLTLTGLDDYLDALQRADKDINQVARAALAEVGGILQSAMIDRVPVDSGNLRDHIKIKTPTKEGDFNYVEVGIIHDVNYTDKQTAIQAIAVEFGSVKMKAQPFVRPAIASSKNVVNNLVRDRLKCAGLVD